MKVFIDDLRTVDMSHNSEKGLGEITDFVIARNDNDFINLVDNHINDISLVSFDHDLACFKDGNEFTGKTACEYLIDKCIDSGRKFPDWYVHTDNTCGRQNIIGLILSYMKKVDGVDISGYKYFHKGFVNGKFV
jgi:hypothetical protein